ncbi:YdeI/OmpD-associated family protein [Maribacter litopenaei]|uniref:YdeI/OmpD-associated family protein n=1 Tax=Maribacter litopenaei TaxID=2976127 RepID=UPI003B8464D3
MPEEMDFPEELQRAFEEDSDLKTAFEKLTPGRQKGYLLYFSGAKQSATRTSRIEKYKSRIFDGKGFHDCVCGQSKKMPSCDGSHKYI